MKKKRRRKFMAAFLAAAVITVLMAGAVSAADQQEEVFETERAEFLEQAEKGPEVAGGQDENGQNETGGEMPESAGEETFQSEESTTGEEIKNEAENEADAGAGKIIPVVLPMQEGAEFDALSGFLTLSSERFCIYILGFLDAETGQQAQPEEAEEVSLAVPAEYDRARTIVSEISMEGGRPQRTELAFEMRGEKAVFVTDHAGIFAVMEKKEQQELPDSLTPTEPVDKVELTGNHGAAGERNKAAGSPKTGDNFPAEAWGGVLAAASAAALAVIRKRSRTNQNGC